MVAGGVLTDWLSLQLSVYVEPKLLSRARVSVQVNEARADTGENLLPDHDFNVMGLQSGSYRTNSNGGSTLSQQIQLLPRQAEGQKLATLRGVVAIRYPLKLQEQELIHLDAAQNFTINTDDVPVEARMEPPRVKDRFLQFSTSLELESAKGGRKIMDNIRRNSAARQRQMLFGIQTGNVALINREQPSPLGQYLLPEQYTLIDTQGRTWIASSAGPGMSLKGPDGTPVPITSPPTPLPDNFTYSEQRNFNIVLVSPGPPPESPTWLTVKTPEGDLRGMMLPPEELAQVSFVKATSIAESDWRTLEVPFEFHDLPLPPR